MRRSPLTGGASALSPTLVYSLDLTAQAPNPSIPVGAFTVDTIGPSAAVALSPAPPLKSGQFVVTLALTDASLVPAARATKVDPIEACRAD